MSPVHTNRYTALAAPLWLASRPDLREIDTSED